MNNNQMPVRVVNSNDGDFPIIGFFLGEDENILTNLQETIEYSKHHTSKVKITIYTVTTNKVINNNKAAKTNIEIIQYNDQEKVDTTINALQDVNRLFTDKQAADHITNNRKNKKILIGFRINYDFYKYDGKVYSSKDNLKEVHISDNGNKQSTRKT